ncbi:MAG: hypothetical protein DRR16_10955 [Candidatus Parabeggiatoa sp. nov. 3]|nr:MAG: hypothetical protein DRR00_16240 [Gammaproteobacteria bacterium]RKZ57825.1 MAG: hypothetical protein DRQ99_26360 [Gammaproteobacteria bacterium]RKZ85916.1 MAG: hypothetical protein DRR16_10955 [Gammaproteobacteria bacterium]
MDKKSQISEQLHAYVINLDHKQKRLQRMESWLNEAHLPWTRIPGINGLSLVKLDIDKINEQAARTLKRGEIGCAMSHIAAWNMATLDSASHVWIMEDDIRPRMPMHELNSEISKIIATGGWDIMYLTGESSTERFMNICSPAHLEPYLNNYSEINEQEIGMRPFYSVGPQIGAYSYILTTNGLEKVSAFFATLINPVDVQLGQMNSWLRTCMWRMPITEHVYDGTSDSRKN